MIKEDGSEKTQQLFVGVMVLSVAGWVLWQFWFGKGLFEGNALVKGSYGSAASEIVQMVFFLVTQLGAISLGLFRVGSSFLKTIGSFLFGSSESKPEVVTPRFNINVSNQTNKPSLSTLKVEKLSSVVVLDTPLFRTNEQGLLFRDVQLEKQLAGPVSVDELAADGVDAFMSGDQDRMNQRFEQLFPEKIKSTVVEVKVDEPNSKA